MGLPEPIKSLEVPLTFVWPFFGRFDLYVRICEKYIYIYIYIYMFFFRVVGGSLRLFCQVFAQKWNENQNSKKRLPFELRGSVQQ